MNEEFGKIYFEVYEGFEDIAKDFVAKTYGAYFTNGAFDYLFCEVEKKLKGSGYTLDGYGKYRYCNELRLTKVNETVILENTVKMSKKLSKTENLTSVSLRRTAVYRRFPLSASRMIKSYRRQP